MLGDPLTGYYDDFPDNAWRYLRESDRNRAIVEIAFVAHYNIKSEQDFDIRARRSVVGNYTEQQKWRGMSRPERERFLAMTNVVEDTYLARYWSRISDPGTCCVFPLSRWPLLSEGCIATQSSVLDEKSLEESAEGPLSGQIANFPAHRTACEDNPWWRVDLGTSCTVHEIRLFNRLDDAIERNANVEIAISEDDRDWIVIHRKTDGIAFGGADGTPYIWCEQAGFQGRYIRVMIPGLKTYLNFSQIQVFGEN